MQILHIYMHPTILMQAAVKPERIIFKFGGGGGLENMAKCIEQVQCKIMLPVSHIFPT